MDYNLTVAIDLGARTTGIASYLYPNNGDPAHSVTGGVVTLEPNDFQLGQRNRTQMRHMRRGVKRRRLAKRLVRLWLAEARPAEFQRLDPVCMATLMGLMNRRGFTYFSLDEKIDDGDLDEHTSVFSELLDDGQPIDSLSQWLRNAVSDPSVIDAILEQPVFALDYESKRNSGPLTDFLRDRLDADIPPTKTAIKAIAKARNNLRDLLRKARDTESTGHRHRSDYFDVIRKDLHDTQHGKRLCKALDMGADELTALLGHIGNWTLKALRGYFHDASKATSKQLDIGRFHTAWERWFQTWTVQGERGTRRKARKQARSEWMSRLGEVQPDDIHAHWKLLTTTDPVSSIPPFESQANRRPPKCQSLLLYPSKLDRHAPNWRIWAQTLLRHDDTTNLAQNLDDIGKCDAKELSRHRDPSEKGTPDADASAWQLARALQRLLERSRSTDPYALRALAKAVSTSKTIRGTDEARRKLENDLGSQHIEEFLRFAQKYFEESRGAREGMWRGHANDGEALLKTCGAHPPHKEKILDDLVKGVLNAEVTEMELRAALEALEAKIAFPERRIGPRFRRPPARRPLAILKELADLQKKWGGRLRQFADAAEQLERRNGDTPPKGDVRLEAWKASRWAEVIADAVGRQLGHDEAAIQRYRNPYSLAQLHQLLFTDRRGFASNCRACVQENAWRAQLDNKNLARASRLPADSVRPFDGMLARLLSALAARIARRVAEDVRANVQQGRTTNLLTVNLVIEENRFEFVEQLSSVKGLPGKKQKDRAEAAQRDREALETEWADKRQRIRDASRGVCAYTGANLGNDVEYDHIVSQALSGEIAGYSFDSEANLLCVSPAGNHRKGRAVYDFDNLHDAYLARIFPGKSRAEAEHLVRERARDWLDNRGLDRVAFHQLPEASQHAVRHALFVPDLRQDVMRQLAQQNRTRVNGTQRWFLHRLWDRLQWELKQTFPATEFAAAPHMHRVKAESVSALRRSLRDLDPIFQKQESQAPYSHVIDAALAFAVASTNPSARADLGLAADDSASLEEFTDPPRAAALLPQSLWIEQIRRTPIYAKSNQQHRPLFKAQMLGERFVPLIIDSEQTVGVGFSPDNSIEVQASGKKESSADVIPRGQRLLELLWPVLVHPACMKHPDLTELARIAAGKPDGSLRLKVDRSSAFAYWADHANDASDERLQVLRGLHYVVAKKNVVDVLQNSKGAPARKDLLSDKLFHFKVAATLKASGVKFEGKLMFPARAAWERIADDPTIAPHLGKHKLVAGTQGTSEADTAPQAGESKAVRIDWPTVMAMHFPRPAPHRAHARIRQVWSLPALTSASGGFRLKRGNPNGDITHQLVQVEKGAYEGFQRDTSKPFGFDPKQPVRMIIFRPLVGLDIGTEASGEVVSFGEYQAQPLASDDSSGISSLEIAPGSSSRRNVRMCISHMGLRRLLVNELPMDPLRNLDATIKLGKTSIAEFASLMKRVTGQGSLGPRDRVDIVHITNDVVELSYTAGGGEAKQARSGTEA